MQNAGLASPWIVKKARPEARARLFCFPYSGGGAIAFRGWAEAMPSVEVCAIQAPGRESRLREPALTRMDLLVAGALEAIRPLAGERPYAFFGHSLGAFVAFEAARALRREGSPMPRHLFASGCPAPHEHVVGRRIHTLSDAELLAALRRYRGTPEEVLRNDDLMSLLLPVLRADFAVYETYRPAGEPALDVPITAFGGLDDDHATPAQIDGWRDHTAQRFERRMFAGHHFFLHEERTRILGDVLAALGPLLR